MESPEHLGTGERHGGILEENLARVVRANNVVGKRGVKLAASVVINIKNEYMRKGGIAPIQWVLGKYPRAVAHLMEEEELTNLAEVSSSFTKDGYEEEAVTLRGRVGALKTKQVEVARIRTAVRMARGVLAQPAPIEQSPAKTSAGGHGGAPVPWGEGVDDGELGGALQHPAHHASRSGGCHRQPTLS